MFLDARRQRSAGSSGGPATDDKIYSTSPPTHTQLCHWLEWSLGHFFLSTLVQLSEMLLHFSVSNALPSDLELLQQFLLQELKVLQ